jgi:tetratricopeptide (TPR) repeat protein
LVLALLTTANVFAQNQTLTPEKREGFIQQAAKLRADGNYFAAANVLDSILLNKPDDAPILLFKGDLLLQSNKFSDAVKIYSRLIPLNYEPTIARINLSYALFMAHKPAKALNEAKNAWEGNKEFKNAIVNYFNAMLWNTKTKPAGVFLAEQRSKINESDNLVLNARLNSTAGNYKAGLGFYDSLSRAFPDKNYVKEYAEVLMSKGLVSKAQQVILKNKGLYSDKEFNDFEIKIKESQKRVASSVFSLFNDIGGNKRFSNDYHFMQSDSKKYPVGLSAGYSNLSSTQGNSINTKFFHAQLKENWGIALKGETDLHILQITPINTTSFGGYTAKQSIKYQPHDRRMLTLFYSKDILNFTPELYQQNINTNNLGYITHIMVSAKTGVYSQGSRGFFSDKNIKNEVFASLYHLISFFPVFKTGLNFSYLTFKEKTLAYFSPDSYSNTELFLDLSGTAPIKFPLKYAVQGGFGLQKIEDRPAEPAMRFQAEMGTNFKSFGTSLKYQTSNVASGTGSGYKFNWLTLTLSYRF